MDGGDSDKQQGGEGDKSATASHRVDGCAKKSGEKKEDGSGGVQTIGVSQGEIPPKMARLWVAGRFQQRALASVSICLPERSTVPRGSRNRAKSKDPCLATLYADQFRDG